MLQDALDSLADIVSPPFRTVMAKSLVLTAAVLVLAWFGLDRLALSLVPVEPPWLATTISLLVGLGLARGTDGPGGAGRPRWSPVSSSTKSRRTSSARSIPSGPPGTPAPALEAAVFALRFAALSVLVNLIALILLFVPGFGIVAWIAANGYLLGREYFELAAHALSLRGASARMRRRCELQVYLAGLLIAGFVAVPLLNLLTPLFATTLMARLHKRLAGAA